MKPRFLPILLASCITAASPASAEDPFADLQPLTDEELDTKRGKFSLGGFELEFGLTVMADGKLLTRMRTNDDVIDYATGNSNGGLVSFSGDASGLRVVENSRDNIVLSHDIVIDLVVTENAPLLSNPMHQEIRNIAPEPAFGSF